MPSTLFHLLSDLNVLGQFATAHSPPTPAGLFGGNQLNPALLTNFITAAAVTSRPLFQTQAAPSNPANQLPPSPTDFPRHQNPYLTHPASIMGGPNPFALTQFMYGTNPWLEGGQQQPFNATSNPISVQSVGTFSGTFPADFDGITRNVFHQQHHHQHQQQPQQIAAHLMAGEALTKHTSVAPPVWPSAFQSQTTVPVAATSNSNNKVNSPGFAIVGGPAVNALGGGAPVFENAGDTNSTATVVSQQAQLRNFI